MKLSGIKLSVAVLQLHGVVGFSAKNPTLRDIHEYILVFSKGMYLRGNLKRKTTISKEEFLEFTKSVWTFAAESAKKSVILHLSQQGYLIG